MTYTTKYLICDHCGVTYIGNANETASCCGRCRRTGHSLEKAKCPVCDGSVSATRDPMANLDDIINTQKKRYG